MSEQAAPRPPFLGLRTVIYPAPDLPSAKAQVTALLGIEPYFDTDFYVGYSVGGYEFALDPHGDPARGAVVYWGVPDADAASARLIAAGAVPDGPVEEVGDGIRTATFHVDAIGGVLGVIENPHFVPGSADPYADGPGR